MKKVCNLCGIEKPISEFRSRVYSSGNIGYHSMCNDCDVDYKRQHYLNNKDKYLKKAKRNSKKYKYENVRFVVEYLQNAGCFMCGISDPVVLEFHHRDASTKEHNLSNMYLSYSLEKVKKEIEKCDVICSNCHRRLHAEERGYLKMTLYAATLRT